MSFDLRPSDAINIAVRCKVLFVFSNEVVYDVEDSFFQEADDEITFLLNLDIYTLTKA